MSKVKIFYLSTCESTQSEVFQLFRNEEREAFAVVTKEQTAGRGRLNREWQTQKDLSLAFSLGWRTKRKDLSGLSLVIGLSIHQYLQDSRLRLKWPNDIMLEDKKIGGVLIETRFVQDEFFIAIGIGLNMFSFGPFAGLESKIDPEPLIDFLFGQMRVFEEQGFSLFQSEFESLLWKKNQRVYFQGSSEGVWATLKGVDSSGALMLEEGGSLKLEMSGEIVHE